MLAMRSLVLFAALIALSTYSAAQAQLHTAQATKTPKSETLGSVDRPLSVKIMPAKDAETKTAEEEKNRKEKAHEDRWLTNSTILLSGVTTILAIFTGGLWYATYKLVSEAKDTAERQLRPYVTMDDMGQGLRLAASGKMAGWFFNPRWTNTGQTPARNVTAWATGRLFKPDIPEDFDFPKPKLDEQSFSVIGPSLFIRSHDVNISADQIVRIMTKDGGKFYVWGRIDYDDVFEGTPRRYTEFCDRVVVARIDDLHTRNAGFPFEFLSHHKYNDAP